MTDRTQTPGRDDVLFAFHQACPRPTVEQIIDWTSRYPQFADDIRAHAAVARDWAAREGLAAEEPSENMLARAYSRALNALYKADAEAKPAEADAAQSFQDIIAARGTSVAALQREVGGTVGIGRSVLADLVNGAMRGPVGQRFLDAVCRAVAINHDRFYAALEKALAAPRVGLAKADAAPTVNARSYDEVIRDSDMTPEQIRYWLGGD
jgi:hypothetical protein